jgi:hypothetical protein
MLFLVINTEILKIMPSKNILYTIEILRTVFYYAEGNCFAFVYSDMLHSSVFGRISTLSLKREWQFFPLPHPSARNQNVASQC